MSRVCDNNSFTNPTLELNQFNASVLFYYTFKSALKSGVLLTFILTFRSTLYVFEENYLFDFAYPICP